MNILIVGNGFDLSHYLPTKYDHFMDVMRSIEEKDLLKHAINEKSYQMSFDQLFFNTRDKGFINKTREFYNTDAVKIDVSKIFEIQKKLKNNGWYQYFSAHVKDIKTWIDFETKIEEVVKIVGKRINEIEKIQSEDEFLNYFNEDNDRKNMISNHDLKILSFFNLVVQEKLTRVISKKIQTGEPFHTLTGNFTNINYIFCNGGKRVHGFNSSVFIDCLNDQLEDFIELFNFYLEEIVKKLKPKKQFNPLKSSKYDLTEIDQIYSFNYTQTYLDFYNSKTKIDFLHGRSGQKQNMVLGISELKSKQLKKIRAYGFTKYHQKLMKDTTYLFLNYFKIKVNQHKKELNILKKILVIVIHLLKNSKDKRLWKMRVN